MSHLKLAEKFKDVLDRWKRYSEISGLGSIMRRYFTMNAFDGVLTALGLILGTFFIYLKNPDKVSNVSIILPGLSTMVAIGISGIIGAYLAEKAERRRAYLELQKDLLENEDKGQELENAKYDINDYYQMDEGTTNETEGMVYNEDIDPDYLESFENENEIINDDLNIKVEDYYSNLEKEENLKRNNLNSRTNNVDDINNTAISDIDQRRELPPSSTNDKDNKDNKENKDNNENKENKDNINLSDNIDLNSSEKTIKYNNEGNGFESKATKSDQRVDNKKNNIMGKNVNEEKSSDKMSDSGDESNITAKAEKFATIILSLTDGLSPAAGAIVGLLPFFFLQMSLAVFILSFIFEIIILFLLGLYLGKISESNLYISGIEMIFAGLITALITLILEGGF